MTTITNACRHCAPGCCTSPFITKENLAAIQLIVMNDPNIFPMQSALIEVIRKMDAGENGRAQIRDFLIGYSKDAYPMFHAAYMRMADLVMQCSFDD